MSNGTSSDEGGGEVTPQPGTEGQLRTAAKRAKDGWWDMGSKGMGHCLVDDLFADAGYDGVLFH